MAATNQVEETNTYGEGFLGGFLITTVGQLSDPDGDGQGGPPGRDLPLRERLPELARGRDTVPLGPACCRSTWTYEASRPANGSCPTWPRGARRDRATCRSRRPTCSSARPASSPSTSSWGGGSHALAVVSSKTWDARTVAFSLIVMSETLVWVRNSSALLVRALAWGWLLVYLVPALFRGRTRVSRRARSDRSSCEDMAQPMTGRRRPRQDRLLFVFGSLERAGAQLRTLEVCEVLRRRHGIEFELCSIGLGPNEIAGRRRTAGRLDPCGLDPVTEVPVRVRPLPARWRVRRDQHRAPAAERSYRLARCAPAVFPSGSSRSTTRWATPARPRDPRSFGRSCPIAVRLGDALADHALRDPRRRGLAQRARQRASRSLAVGL